MKDIFQRIFTFLGLLILLLFVGQLWKDHHRPYLRYQKTFKKLLIQKGGDELETVDFQFGARQRWIKVLNRIDRCETCHLGVEDPRFKDAPQPFRFHPDADTHLFEKFGCTVCHGGQGLATAAENAHGPTENWNAAVLHENFLESSCSLCHGESMQDLAPVLSQGRLLFNEVGCRGCHKVIGKERTRVGPPLDEMGKRVKADWLYRWLRNPRKYLPRTKMSNSLLSDQESADIAGFLLQGTKSQEIEILGSYDSGKKIFGESRCVSCHSIEGKGGNIAPDLARVSSKIYPQRLLRVIKNPHELWPATQMPVYGFTDADIRDIVTFLVEEYIDFELDENLAARQMQLVNEASPPRSLELIEKNGCTGCHTGIEGIKDRGEIGVELSAIGAVHISRLDFGEITVAPAHRTVPNWLYNKLVNPRLFKPGLEMPDFSFNHTEAGSVTTYLLGLKGEEVPASYTLPLGKPSSGYAPQGTLGKILDKYRCLVCHKINGRGGEMAADLSQEGSRVPKEWFINYMKTPFAIRPILEERMPRFKILDAESEALYSYFRTTLVDDRVENLTGIVKETALSASELIRAGKRLYYQKYACNACHQINLKGGAIAPDLTEAGKRLRIAYIVYYLRDPKAFVKRSVEPVFNLTDEEIEALTAFLVNSKEEG